jgi:hypothetical protein
LRKNFCDYIDNNRAANVSTCVFIIKLLLFIIEPIKV